MQLTSGTLPSLAMLLALLMAGCATPPPPKPINAEERIRQDNSLGLQLAAGLEPQFAFKKDVEVSVYLRRLAQTLADSTAELHGAPVGVLMIQDRDQRWHNYSLPGNRIYLSISLLRSLEFENELAAAIAIEFGHVVRRHALSRLENLPSAARLESPALEGILPVQPAPLKTSVEYFGPGGIFAFSKDDQFEAVDAAVQILYRAGYDARGLVSLFGKYQENPAVSPDDAADLARLVEHARQVIAVYTPLRNPVVRSEAFLAIQKRIQKL